MDMNRRTFLQSSLAATGGLIATGFAPSAFSAQGLSASPSTEGAVTLYTEFRVIPSQNAQVLAAIDALAKELRARPGFLSLALKQMSGDSTMVKNYPERYKGVLATAYLDGVEAHTQPVFYALFIRFNDATTLQASGAAQAFDKAVLPLLHPLLPAAQGPQPGPQPMAIYRGLFVTVAAGDRNGIYSSPAAIRDFLRRPVDLPERDTVSVENHVMVADAGHLALEPQVAALLKIAQGTYQPMDEANGIGLPGASDNRHYRKALSTEILRNVHADGDLRAYLLHGVWESVWDHENSHLDPRFQAAVAPVGAAVMVGPVEPFYVTRQLVSAA
jgi:quinol monooxygenase YgiN